MNKQTIRAEIKRYLADQHEILFAYIFGSFVEEERFRDIDIAIYTGTELDLLRLGLMETELGERVSKSVDLTCLNNMPGNHPAFVYAIVTNGELLLNKNPQHHTRFKKKTLLHYFDTAHLRREIDKAFSKRLESDKFGQRNYE
ncbi:nucleotidyltransferase domain-containing protein [Aliifodinibius sp. S!AR15-10]|uniref:nucleotidyltransferase domain-containing protein n=1 Tax=Aliifodinibius sp. S!AR15-10 TaxID=2950437 RepID=UPI00286378A5|nr:nucleotidyltransferase domain-containing protein [Aliifodinibius sp. S!AR15-10]MDR8393398.1 nucleotidyltransferase domain-containing protein [Aliifodinibius sp. S!AR15-10]